MPCEVSVTKQLLRKFPNSQKSWGNWACVNSVYQALFSPPTHKSLVTRLESSQTTLATKQFGVPLEVWVQLGVCLYWAWASICNLAHLFQQWSCTVATYMVAVSDENVMLFHSIIISVSSSCSKHCIAKLFCVELSLYNCITARISWLLVVPLVADKLKRQWLCIVYFVNCLYKTHCYQRASFPDHLTTC